jgi:hypothetical protein
VIPVMYSLMDQWAAALRNLLWPAARGQHSSNDGVLPVAFDSVPTKDNVDSVSDSRQPGRSIKTGT